MDYDVIISCAVTGDDTKVTKSPYCAVTPSEIAATAVAAAKAGAAIAHLHARDPDSGAFSMETKHYREAVKQIRESGTDVIVNLTCGMGGYINAQLVERARVIIEAMGGRVLGAAAAREKLGL